MQERDKKEKCLWEAIICSRKVKSMGGTAEDNGILTKNLQNTRKENSRLNRKASARIGEKFLSQDTKDTHALEKHTPEMSSRALTVAQPCRDTHANSDRCSESEVSITKLSTTI